MVPLPNHLSSLFYYVMTELPFSCASSTSLYESSFSFFSWEIVENAKMVRKWGLTAPEPSEIVAMHIPLIKGRVESWIFHFLVSVKMDHNDRTSGTTHYVFCIPMSDSPHHKKVSSGSQMNFLMCFNLCALPPTLPAGRAEKSLAPSSSFPTIRCLDRLIRLTLRFLPTEQSHSIPNLRLGTPA